MVSSSSSTSWYLGSCEAASRAPNLRDAAPSRASSQRRCSSPGAPDSSSTTSTARAGYGERRTDGPEEGWPRPTAARLAHEQQGLPHLASSLLGHMVAVRGLQLLLLAGCPVLPGQVPHSSLVLEFSALVAAQLHVPKEDLLISQLCFQVLQLFPLPLRQIFSARLLAELRDLGREGRSNPHPTGAATQFPTRGVWELERGQE